MTVISQDLRDYVGTELADPHIESAFEYAEALIARYVGDRDDIPDVVLDRATLEVGAAVYRRGGEPSQDASQYLDAGVVPVRQPRDPIAVAYGVLKDWMPGGFG